MNIKGKDIRAVLITDLERVAKSFRHKQKCVIALALKERVGGHRRAHFDGCYLFRGDRLAWLNAEKVADSLQSRIIIGVRIFGEEFPGRDGARRRARNNIRERTATVDPKFPFFTINHRGKGNILWWIRSDLQ